MLSSILGVHQNLHCWLDKGKRNTCIFADLARREVLNVLLKKGKVAGMELKRNTQKAEKECESKNQLKVRPLYACWGKRGAFVKDFESDHYLSTCFPTFHLILWPSNQRFCKFYISLSDGKTVAHDYIPFVALTLFQLCFSFADCSFLCPARHQRPLFPCKDFRLIGRNVTNIQMAVLNTSYSVNHRVSVATWLVRRFSLRCVARRRGPGPDYRVIIMRA